MVLGYEDREEFFRVEIGDIEKCVVLFVLVGSRGTHGFLASGSYVVIHLCWGRAAQPLVRLEVCIIAEPGLKALV